MATTPQPNHFEPLQWPGQHRYSALEDSSDRSPEPGPEHSPEHSPEPEQPSIKYARQATEVTDVTEPPPYDSASPRLADASLPWRPFYLQRRILLSFAAVFALIVVAIETLLAVSERNDGLVTPAPGLRYLWTYGPTAFLILIAAFWSRAEYQSKLVAPWVRLSTPGVHPKQTLLLDYLSDFQLYAVFKALRNRDFVVSIACTVAIVIKAIIVISTGLIALSWTQIRHDAWPMMLQDRFVDTNTRLSHTGTLAWYVMEGLAARNLTYPEGIYTDYAFQSVAADFPDTAETYVTVDGFENSLECEPADLGFWGSAPPNPHYRDQVMNVTITSPACNLRNLTISPSPGWTCGPGSEGPCNVLFSRFALVQCDEASDVSGKRILVMFGNLTYTIDESVTYEDYTGHMSRHPYITELRQSTQMLCVPTYAVTTVDVVRNGTQTLNVTAKPGAERRTLGSVTAWDLMDAHYANFINSMTDPYNVYGHTVGLADTWVDADVFMQLALTSQFPPNESLASLLEPAFLQQIATGYYSQFGAIVAKQSLMEPASVPTTGSIIRWDNRLVVRNWAAHWMAGLTAVCLVLTVTAAFLVPRRGILPCSPTTLPGMASLVAHSPDLLAMLRFSGAADAKSLGRPLLTSSFTSGVVVDPVSSKQHFAILSEQRFHDRRSHTFTQVNSKHAHPGVLHPGARLALCLLLIGLIVTLELTLRKSNDDNGLGDVGGNTYIHYTWTAVPAVAFGALSMLFSAMDFQVRSLAPYTELKRTVTAKAFLTLDFMDMSVPRTIYNELKFGNIGALAATAAFLIASVFTIFSASLFQPLAMSTTIPLTLRANQSFDPLPFAYKDGNAIASLIFESNLSYPMFTYEDLAFPQLVSELSLPADGSVNPATLSIKGIVPAVRSKLECRIYDASKIRTNLTLNYTADSNYENPLGVSIEGEECNLELDDEIDKYNHILSTASNMTYFALTDSGTYSGSIHGCSQLLYTWGKLNYTTTPIIQHISALGCNETIEALSVSTTFTGSTTLAIDPNHPPLRLENTTHPSTITPFDDPYNYLAELTTAPNHLQPFFGMLTTSPWAVPLTALGDATQTETIADAIQLHHRMIIAQNLAQQLQPANASNATLTPDFMASVVNATDDMPLYNGTATTPEGEGRRRVVQDVTSTRILQGLLAVAVVLVAIGWVCMRETDVLPRSPTTVASVVALLAGGDLFERKYQRQKEEGGDGDGPLGWLLGGEGKDADVGGEGRGEKSSLKGVKFWMGWGTVTDHEGREDGGENEGGVSRFGIFVVRDGDGEKEDKTGLMAG